ncbi:replication-associated recombination protein A [uncultured Ilyobacter sp.]|uniref:replication-associated recombination protein A n=1 Tax=uncultured Ilyobacter sp. TaxID=544433 RepID=UPI0029C7F862|nr:replication-associated recombination protein A [uncultured Ilyobacter sp.]
MKSLFHGNYDKIRPLAYQMRPKTLLDYVGQEEIIGEKSVLRKLISKGKMVNSIFFGPPGTGKTSLAELIAEELSYSFEKMNATTANLGDFREVVERAKKRVELENRRTLLFLDEIHRFNKLQQDSLLPYTEEGLIVLVGATTENPYYTLNNALLSRCMVFEFKKLEERHVIKLIQRGCERLGVKEKLTSELEEIILELSKGDARVALNYVELFANTAEDLDENELKDLFKKRNDAYHKKEDKYNIVSAFIKSIRGSDPDAAVYWMARMLSGGEDPRYIARRLVILASEDVGMANPEAMLVAHAAMDASEKIGMPEIRIILSQAAIYLAISSKSNSSYIAVNTALEDISKGNLEDVPKHLKNQYGELYKYPHSHPGNFVHQVYKKDRKKYYNPGDNKNERLIAQKLLKLWDEK